MAVTRAEVARAAGVSPALVSYVLNRGPRPVSAAATARVLRAIDELGYRPNQIARALRERRTRTVAMIMPDHENPHFSELAQRVENEAFARGYVLLIGTTDNDSSRELEYLHSFVDRQVDGLILISSTSRPHVAPLSRAGLPVVLLDRAPTGSNFSTVTVDNRAAAGVAVQHLIDHGHENIATITGPENLPAVQDRIAGWRQVVAAVGKRPARVPADFSRDGGYRAMADLLARNRRPEAVFIHSDAQAIGALKACAEYGARVPDDLAVMSFDGTQAGTFTNPVLTTMDQGTAELARSTIDVLVDILQQDREAVHRQQSAALRLGRSCGC